MAHSNDLLTGDAFQVDKEDLKIYGTTISASVASLSLFSEEDMPESKCNTVSFMKVEPFPSSCRNLLAASESYICYSVRKNLLRVIHTVSTEKGLLRGHESPALDLKFSTADRAILCSIDGDTQEGAPVDAAHTFIWQMVDSPGTLMGTTLCSLKLKGVMVQPHPKLSQVWAISDGSSIGIISVILASSGQRLNNYDQLSLRAKAPEGDIITDLSFSADGSYISACIMSAEKRISSVAVWRLPTSELLINCEGELVMLPSMISASDLVAVKFMSCGVVTASKAVVVGDEGSKMLSVLLHVWPFNEEEDVCVAGPCAATQRLNITLPIHSSAKEPSYSSDQLALSVAGRFLVLSHRRSSYVVCLAVDTNVHAHSHATTTGVRIPIVHGTFLDLKWPVYSADATIIAGKDHHSAEEVEHLEICCYQEQAGGQTAVQQYHVPCAQICYPLMSLPVGLAPLYLNTSNKGSGSALADLLKGSMGAEKTPTPDLLDPIPTSTVPASSAPLAVTSTATAAGEQTPVLAASSASVALADLLQLGADARKSFVGILGASTATVTSVLPNSVTTSQDVPVASPVNAAAKPLELEATLPATAEANTTAVASPLLQKSNAENSVLGSSTKTDEGVDAAPSDSDAVDTTTYITSSPSVDKKKDDESLPVNNKDAPLKGAGLSDLRGILNFGDVQGRSILNMLGEKAKPVDASIVTTTSEAAAESSAADVPTPQRTAAVAVGSVPSISSPTASSSSTAELGVEAHASAPTMTNASTSTNSVNFSRPFSPSSAATTPSAVSSSSVVASSVTNVQQPTPSVATAQQSTPHPASPQVAAPQVPGGSNAKNANVLNLLLSSLQKSQPKDAQQEAPPLSPSMSLPPQASSAAMLTASSVTNKISSHSEVITPTSPIAATPATTSATPSARRSSSLENPSITAHISTDHDNTVLVAKIDELSTVVQGLSAMVAELKAEVAESKSTRKTDQIAVLKGLKGEIAKDFRDEIAKANSNVQRNAAANNQVIAQLASTATTESLKKIVEVEARRALEEGLRAQKWKEDLATQISETLHKELAPALSSRLRDSVKETVRDTVKNALISTFKDAFESTLLPSFQAGTDRMFAQVQEAFDMGVDGLIEEGRRAQEVRDTSQAEVVNEISSLRAAITTLGEQVTSSLTASATAAAAATTAAAGPVAKVLADPIALLELGRIPEAVECALEWKDTNVLIGLLERLTPADLAANCNRLVQLCTCQQLAGDMSSQEPKEGLSKRLEWLKNLIIGLLLASSDSISRDPSADQYLTPVLVAMKDSLAATESRILESIAASNATGDAQTTHMLTYSLTDLRMLTAVIASKA